MPGLQLGYCERMEAPVDDLSHLQPELAGQLRVALARWHRVFEGASLDEEMAATAQVGFLVVQLVHIQAHEMARMRQERKVARITTALALVATGIALATLWR